ncbi:MarR family transcriptional regulator [Schleiferilactobacillus perolens]|nr:MarR family transcriptional regulator [Schleiferilactobacillus perolens]
MTEIADELLTTFRALMQKGTFRGAMVSSWWEKQNQQPNQLRVLQLLVEKGELTNRDFVDALDIRPSSVSALVQKLEDAGFIERHDSPTDKRVQLIAVTDKGHQFVHTTTRFANDLPSKVFQPLSAQEQSELLRLLSKLNAGIPEDVDFQWPEGKQFDRMRAWAEHFRQGGGRDFPNGFGRGPRGFN